MSNRSSSKIRVARGSEEIVIQVAQSPEDVFQEMAEFIQRTITDRLRESPDRFSLALSGGNSPRGLHRVLVSKRMGSGIPWSQVDFFWGDERCVPPDHPESNYRMARETLLSPLGIQDQQVFRIPGETGPEAGALTYERDVRRYFNFRTEAPKFDLIILGLGTDGHTASLFPEQPGIRKKDRLVVPVSLELPEISRISFSLDLINHAVRVAFLVIGQDKAVSLKEVVLPDPATPVLPARLVAPATGQVHFFVDSAASRLVGQPG